MTDNNANNSYLSDRKPRSHFATRREYLEHELQVMAPRRWRPNLPFRDYRFEWEDLVPAMAATIGKVVMVAAIVAAFAGPLGLSKEFVTENVRFEMIIAALLFVILISGFLNPTSNLAGACENALAGDPAGLVDSRCRGLCPGCAVRVCDRTGHSQYEPGLLVGRNHRLAAGPSGYLQFYGSGSVCGAGDCHVVTGFSGAPGISEAELPAENRTCGDRH